MEAEPVCPAGDCRDGCLYRGPVHLPPGHHQGAAPGGGGGRPGGRAGPGRGGDDAPHHQDRGALRSLQRDSARPPETDGLLRHQDRGVRESEGDLPGADRLWGGRGTGGGEGGGGSDDRDPGHPGGPAHGRGEGEDAGGGRSPAVQGETSVWHFRPHTNLYRASWTLTGPSRGQKEWSEVCTEELDPTSPGTASSTWARPWCTTRWRTPSSPVAGCLTAFLSTSPAPSWLGSPPPSWPVQWMSSRQGQDSPFYQASYVTFLNSWIRFMNSPSGKYRGVLHCAGQTARQEGPMAFYRGFKASCLRLVSWNIVLWISYEQLKIATKNFYNQSK